MQLFIWLGGLRRLVHLIAEVSIFWRKVAKSAKAHAAIISYSSLCNESSDSFVGHLLTLQPCKLQNTFHRLQNSLCALELSPIITYIQAERKPARCRLALTLTPWSWNSNVTIDILETYIRLYLFLTSRLVFETDRQTDRQTDRHRQRQCLLRQHSWCTHSDTVWRCGVDLTAGETHPVT